MKKVLTTSLSGFQHRIISPLRAFMNDNRAVGCILIICTLASLFISNSGNGGWYINLWKFDLNQNHFLNLPESPLHWINDFLMGFFFLTAGMEIKRELVNGELSTFKKAALPFGAAFGGMLVPALIFVCFNLKTSFLHGWGIPTATDIAFSLGVASLLGKRIPLSLKIFLMALAIIDDLGAIVVIALFYGGQIHWTYLAIAAVIYILLFACNYFKLKFGAVQIILGICLWFAVLNSGIEAGITGVLFALAIPVKQIPAIQKALHFNVNFVILPLFALANTAILFPGNVIESLQTTIGMGIIVGLVVGKPLGIFLMSKLLVFLNIASLPKNIKWQQILGMGTLAGIGFTMSIFTTMLAFNEPRFHDIAKISILVSVVLSVFASIIYFRTITPKVIKTSIQPQTADLSLNLS
jgi:NhaA family Na+:H+ antiporter